MVHDDFSWDEKEETGLHLCEEISTQSVSLPSKVMACCWDPNNPELVGLCGADGSFVLARYESEIASASSTYAVYFNTLPVHLWGRRGGDDSRNFSTPTSTPARRVDHAWSQVSFVPGHAGEVILVFVQGWSRRILLTAVPKMKPRRSVLPVPLFSSASHQNTAAGRRFGLLDGSRVVALDGHQAQVRCLAIDNLGNFLLTGDESGAICARFLSRLKPNDVDYGSTYRNIGLGQTLGEGGVRLVAGAHEGAVLAISHIFGSLKGADDQSEERSVLFVSGGVGGVVRLWRATTLLGGTNRAETEVRVDILMDMLVGGLQVSCLAASLSYQVPLVLAGTSEGTVFAFLLREPPSKGAAGNSFSASPSKIPGRISTAINIGVEKSPLGLVLMKFKHTSSSIEDISCSRDQELIAVADADGILRTYRPASIGNPLFSQNGVEDGTGLGVMIRPFELIVECRLGACPALCEFALETKERKQNQTKARQGSQHREEVLRTCTRDGGLRVWPSSSLPKRPARLPAMAQVEPPSPPQAPSIPSDTSIAKALNNIPNELETAEAGYEQHNGDSCEPFARWIAVEAAGGSVEQGEKEAAEQPSVARGNAPLPRVRPLAPRRVSFAPAEQVYRFQDPYTSTSQQPQELKQQHQEDEEYKKREHDDELEGPRPPPPAPMLAPSASSSKISRPRQAWRISPLEGNGKRGSTTSKGMSMLTSTSEGEDLSVYLTPSRLQEPSMWSTAMEQAMLERRLRESCDVGTAQEPAVPTYRAAAATAVNIHPKAKIFEGLIPVSLDAPPTRVKRKGKQVSKAHLSKVQEMRITDEDLLFDDIEPANSFIKGLGRSGMWRHDELEWDGGQAAYVDSEDSSWVSDRVWSWGILRGCRP